MIWTVKLPEECKPVVSGYNPFVSSETNVAAGGVGVMESVTSEFMTFLTEGATHAAHDHTNNVKNEC